MERGLWIKKQMPYYAKIYDLPRGIKDLDRQQRTNKTSAPIQTNVYSQGTDPYIRRYTRYLIKEFVTAIQALERSTALPVLGQLTRVDPAPTQW